MFDSLFAKRLDIEAALDGETVSWERLDDGAASRVAVYRSYNKEAVNEDTPQRRELFEWIEKNLSRMRELAKAAINDS